MGSCQSSDNLPVGSMGCPDSPKRVDVALHVLSEPFLATNNGCVAETFTSFFIKVPTRGGVIDIIDVQHGQLAFELRDEGASRLQRPNGGVLVSMKNSHVYEGDWFRQHSFAITSAVHAFSHAVVSASFCDALSGDACRVSIEGDFYDREVVFYLERGHAATTTSTRQVKGRGRPSGQAVGRIRQPRTSLGEVEEYCVEAAPGVDITLILLMWLVRYHIDRAQRFPE